VIGVAIIAPHVLQAIQQVRLGADRRNRSLLSLEGLPTRV